MITMLETVFGFALLVAIIFCVIVACTECHVCGKHWPPPTYHDPIGDVHGKCFFEYWEANQ